jgi:hypothetical protein
MPTTATKTRAAFVLFALLATLPVARQARAADTPIQPGAQITAPAGCTMNFVFRDAEGAQYIGTAGHCVSGTGVRVSANNGEFGTVVYRIFAGNNDDFALIEIDPSRYDEVNPSMRRWGGPTGVTTADTTGIGDTTLQYGYGIGYGSTEVTRPRAGALWNDNDREYRAEHPAIFGDSGGPVLHGPTGRALGITANISVHLMNGPTIERVLALLAERGIEVSLVLADFTPPV